MGAFITYLLFMNALPLFGVDLEIPLKEYSDQIVYSVFAFGILLLFFCVYVCCSLFAAIYFFPMVKKWESRVGRLFQYCFQKSVSSSLAANVKNRMLSINSQVQHLLRIIILYHAGCFKPIPFSGASSPLYSKCLRPLFKSYML